MEKKYYKHKIQNLLVISEIVAVHYLEFNKNFKTNDEFHDFWELVYVDKGDIICISDGHETTLREGEVIFHKPNVSHWLRADGKRAPNVFVICFECKNEAMHFFEDRKMALSKDLLHYIFNIIDESKKTFDLPFPDPDLKKMKLLETPALGGQQFIKNYLELLLISLMRNESEQSNSEAIFLPQEKFGEVISDRIIEYMNDHITERLWVSDVCDLLHYNKSYIFRQFKKTTGSSIMSYFIKLKIERAKRMLRESDLPISAISESLSFDAPDYFSKTFKKHAGYTPSTYRKMHSAGKVQ